ncbi:LysR family transcriptional regulator [Burkholderia multivorans]|uniref:LysR substrate-binding domain-containing protein n=1 Tax=Burkholderia multivorans TaxID=87883 RepID=UPI000CFF8680|nr:LysR substrate-binding domain-containing protein [Burkholderia multivorans]PRG72195.1 LysR family transcriptional regulator [Burkholderia multivorans]
MLGCLGEKVKSIEQIDLRHLRVFVAVAEELHFTKAAERLALGQPVVSRLLTDLEDGLSVKLLHRTTRAAELTDAGKVLLIEARRIIDQFVKATVLTQRAGAGLQEQLRIGYSEFAINGGLPSVVRNFREHFPNVTLELRYMTTLNQRAAMLRGEIDAGFVQGMFDNPLVDNHLFQQDHLILVMSDRHPMSGRSDVALDELRSEPFVFGDNQIWGTFREAVFDACRRKGFVPRIVQEANAGAGILGLVTAGIGMTIYASIDGTLSRQGIATVPIKDGLGSISTFFIRLKEQASPYSDQFAQFVKEHRAERAGTSRAKEKSRSCE